MFKLKNKLKKKKQKIAEKTKKQKIYLFASDGSCGKSSGCFRK